MCIENAAKNFKMTYIRFSFIPSSFWCHVSNNKSWAPIQNMYTPVCCFKPNPLRYLACFLPYSWLFSFSCHSLYFAIGYRLLFFVFECHTTYKTLKKLVSHSLHTWIDFLASFSATALNFLRASKTSEINSYFSVVIINKSCKVP